MDRVISLLAALVGLIALGGAILVHTNADVQRREMATEIAQLKATISLNGTVPQAAATPAAAAPASSAPDSGVADALLALQDRIAALEQTTRDQSAQLEAARAQISAMPSSAEPVTQVATTDPSAPAPASGVTPAAVVADGPTKDCIPLGTRFMASAGDSFPICKTKVVVKIASVDDGLATINGAGDVAAGSIGQLDKGCTVSVFSADTSGYAEMRVTCQ